MSEAEEAAIGAALARHERETTEQIVVATLESLQGRPIEEYGYQLGRHWGIGQEGEDNGALLIVVPSERAVRIEVGYGLEGRLTDALSRIIIENEILPRFRAGDLEAGATAMVAALSGSYEAPLGRSHGDSDAFGLMMFVGIALGLVLLAVVVGLVGGRRGWQWQWRYITDGYDGGSRFGGGGDGWASGGGRRSSSRRYRGGGGSFGGGGASGRW